MRRQLVLQRRRDRPFLKAWLHSRLHRRHLRRLHFRPHFGTSLRLRTDGEWQLLGRGSSSRGGGPFEVWNGHNERFGLGFGAKQMHIGPEFQETQIPPPSIPLVSVVQLTWPAIEILGQSAASQDHPDSDLRMSCLLCMPSTTSLGWEDSIEDWPIFDALAGPRAERAGREGRSK